MSPRLVAIGMWGSGESYLSGKVVAGVLWDFFCVSLLPMLK